MNIQTQSQPKPSMDTSQQLRHVFACQGTTVHVYPGFKLLRAGDITRCPNPECGAEVHDITQTPLGQSYLAFARPDLGERPSSPRGTL